MGKPRSHKSPKPSKGGKKKHSSTMKVKNEIVKDKKIKVEKNSKFSCISCVKITLLSVLGILLGLFGVYFYLRRPRVPDYGIGYAPLLQLPKREELISRLKSDEFDIVFIGGGASGTAAAVDAASRGLNVAVIEWEDYGQGTSSRSTKLLHGGVRYLRKALERHDLKQLLFVFDALEQRAVMFDQAPHLTEPRPILTPLYDEEEVKFNKLLLKLYDWIAIPKLENSYFLTAEESLKEYPMLKAEDLLGSMVYYDGQFDDSRYDLALAMKAIEMGAVSVNHSKVIDILKDEENMVNGVTVEDQVSGEMYSVKAKAVVNTTGHFADEVRLMDNAEAKSVLTAACGTHIVIDGEYSNPNTGVLIPKTDDGRVIFLLPWKGHTLVGTTNHDCSVTNNPRPTEKEIEYIIEHINRYSESVVTRKDVLSAWSGIRPLKKVEDEGDSAQVSREHAIYVSPSNLMTLVGGKWTTTMKMGKDIVDRALSVADIKCKNKSHTRGIKLVGASEYNPDFENTLVSMFGEKGITKVVAHHLMETYGDQAKYLLDSCHDLTEDGKFTRLVAGHPYLKCEVRHAVKNEYALTPVDFLSLRIRLALLDNNAAREAVPVVVAIMAEELGWDEETSVLMTQNALEYLV
eukprot:gnl/Carplike_NY0171/956_a1314_1503.p1 GENE.gnl/Carplike_NY0171/956_a1314_1503~~gnl/Carplike_NY0171/956_a1314_1503.p1  ORF type:complete len:630 (+),score=214.41 gnl/Carplike_NY0171/956_a1314_1503:5-1894(+)